MLTPEYRGGRLGDYKVLDEIGAGGMGRVFLAENIHHRKQYALKILPQELSCDGNFRQRFFDEARVMSELDHPRIVRVHHIGEHEGAYYLVMDYVIGPDGKPRSLRDELGLRPDKRIDPLEAHRWITQIAEGLAYAHKKGVIHRDIKPANILVAADRDVKITDFGLAKAIGSEFILSQMHQTMQSLSLGNQRTIVDKNRSPARQGDSLDLAETLEGTPSPDRRSSGSTGILGTYDYMSPEQREGTAVDARTDVYSLGVLIYQILTGRRPVGLAKPPSHLVKGVPADWDRVVERCLEDEPSQRYQDVETMLTELWAIGTDRPAQRQAAPAEPEYAHPAPASVPSQASADPELVTKRIRSWVENRKAEWTEDEWKDFVIGLHDDGCAVGLSHKKLETMREQEKKAWIKAQETRKAEEARLAEERRRAVEDAEGKRKEAEEARKRREEEQLLDEIKTQPTIPLCERYLREYPAGRYRNQSEKTLSRLRGEQQSRTRTTKVVAALLAVAIVGSFVAMLFVRRPNAGAPRTATRGTTPVKENGRSGQGTQPQGDTWIVVKQHKQRADLDDVKDFFAKYGIDLVVESLADVRKVFADYQLDLGGLPKGDGFMLVTNDRYNNLDNPGTDGYAMRQKIIEVGKKYKAAPGRATFAPEFFSDAYGMKLTRGKQETKASPEPVRVETLPVSPPAEPKAGDVITNSIGMKLAWIPPGEFPMGSPDSENERTSNEGPQHRVRLTKGFFLGVYEVTQRQWQAVMGSNPSNFKGDGLPVEGVSWDDAVEFCRQLSVREGAEYRLPTEAEWEYACRAGTTSAYSFGDSGSDPREYAWYYGFSGGQAHPVGQRKPNALGLYDMHGNVMEWCQDWYAFDAYHSEPVTDPPGPPSGDLRVVRGGSWRYGFSFCRSANRGGLPPADRSNYVGLRLARTTPSHP